jgi:hypothetical protein
MLAHRLCLGHALPDHRDDRRDVFERAIVGVIPGLREVGQVIDGDPVSSRISRPTRTTRSATTTAPPATSIRTPAPSAREIRGTELGVPPTKPLRSDWSPLGAFGGCFGFIRWSGPVCRFGRNPAICLFFGRKITDMRDGSMSSTYGNGPTTVLDHFRVKFWFLAHPKNTRLQRNGSIRRGTAGQARGVGVGPAVQVVTSGCQRPKEQPEFSRFGSAITAPWHASCLFRLA